MRHWHPPSSNWETAFAIPGGRKTISVFAYNFGTKKALISEVVTKQGEQILHGQAVFKNAKGELLSIRNGFTTCDLDMQRHYRPRVNVVQRPVLAGGEGYEITGHHEIMVPLLVWAVVTELG